MLRPSSSPRIVRTIRPELVPEPRIVRTIRGGGGHAWLGVPRFKELLFGESLLQPPDDFLERRAGREDLLHPALLQARDVVVRDDAAAEDDDVGRLAAFQLLSDRAGERPLGAPR